MLCNIKAWLPPCLCVTVRVATLRGNEIEGYILTSAVLKIKYSAFSLRCTRPSSGLIWFSSFARSFSKCAARSSTFRHNSACFWSRQNLAALRATLSSLTQFCVLLCELCCPLSSKRNAKTRRRHNSFLSLFVSSRRRRVEMFQSSVPRPSSSSCLAASTVEGASGRVLVWLWSSAERFISRGSALRRSATPLENAALKKS